MMINDKLSFKECRAVFERKKTMHHLNKLTEAYKNRDTILISDCTKNMTALIAEVHEITEHCNSNKQLSSILKYLYNFVEHIIQSDLPKNKKWLFKKEAFDAFLREKTGVNDI